MTDHAGAVYLEHIRDQLAEQRDRKKSLEQRGQTSVAVSGGLVTLLLAFADVGVLDPTGSPAISRLVLIAIGLLVLGAVAGVYVAVPHTYDEASVIGLRTLLTDNKWSEPIRVGEVKVARNLLNIIVTARRSNGVKAKVLVTAVGLQVAGVYVMAGTLIGSII